MKKSTIFKALRIVNYVGSLFAALTVEASALMLAPKIKNPFVRTIVQIGAIVGSAFGWELAWKASDNALYNKQNEAEHEEEEDFLG